MLARGCAHTHTVTHSHRHTARAPDYWSSHGHTPSHGSLGQPPRHETPERRNSKGEFQPRNKGRNPRTHLKYYFSPFIIPARSVTEQPGWLSPCHEQKSVGLSIGCNPSTAERPGWALKNGFSFEWQLRHVIFDVQEYRRTLLRICAKP